MQRSGVLAMLSWLQDIKLNARLILQYGGLVELAQDSCSFSHTDGRLRPTTYDWNRCLRLMTGTEGGLLTVDDWDRRLAIGTDSWFSPLKEIRTIPG